MVWPNFGAKSLFLWPATGGDKVSNIDKWYYRGDEVSRKQGLLGAGPAKSLPLESCVREDEVFQQQSLLVAELA